MAPLTRDSVEVANPSGDVAAPQTTPARSATGLRSDAVSLEVAVKVHGSRVIDVARGTAPQTEPFEEQTVTMIVFPQGAVLRMTTTVNVSQMLVLTNVKTKQDSICRVLKVRPNANQGSYVEVEFTHRQPGYWGVNFPSESAAPASPVAAPHINSEIQARPPVAAAPAVPVIPAAPAIKPVAPTPVVTREVASSVAPPAASVAPPKPESSFISIGSQESVQDAASATEITRPLSPVERRLQNPAPPVATSTASTIATDALSEPVPAPPIPSMEDLLGDTGSTSSSAAAVSDETDSSSTAESAAVSTISGFATASSVASHSAASESFGARLDSSFGASSARDTGSNQNWMLIAASIALLVAVLGAGIVYFRQHPANGSAQSGVAAHNAVSASQPVAASSNQLPAITPTNQPYMPVGSETNPNPTPKSKVSAANVGAAPVAAPSANSVTEARTPAPSANRPAVPAKPSAPGVTTNMVSSALTARPATSPRRDDAQAEQAPTLDPDAAASNPGALAGIAPANAASLPSPEMRPEGPVKIGGNVKEPKLISSVLPQYPNAARASRQQGDVVVETTIDKSGNVVRMHVVSGPTSLRSAATDALRRWRYEPSRLDGEPVEVQLLVTIKFKL